MRRLVLALALALAGCAPTASGGGPQDRLAAVIQTAAQTAKPFRLADATDFAWDRLYVFAPYTPRADIERELGFAWPEASRVRLEERDNIALLVFVQGKRVVKHMAFPRHLGDWAMMEHQGGYARADAVFSVTRESADPAWLIVTDTRPPR